MYVIALQGMYVCSGVGQNLLASSWLNYPVTRGST